MTALASRFTISGDVRCFAGEALTVELAFDTAGSLVDLTGREWAWTVYRANDREPLFSAAGEVVSVGDDHFVRFAIDGDTTDELFARNRIGLRHEMAEVTAGGRDVWVEGQFSIAHSAATVSPVLVSATAGSVTRFVFDYQTRRLTISPRGGPGFSAAQQLAQAGVIDAPTIDAMAEWQRAPAIDAAADVAALTLDLGQAFSEQQAQVDDAIDAQDEAIAAGFASEAEARDAAIADEAEARAKQVGDFGILTGAALNARVRVDAPQDLTVGQKVRALLNIGGASDADVVAAHRIAQTASDAGMRLSSAFGDRGPGYDNTAAIQDCITATKATAGRKGALFAPWTSDVQMPLNFGDLEGVTIAGVPGLSRLRGGADYGLVQLGHLNDVHFDGVGFVSTHVSAVEDGGKSIVYSFQKRVERVTFERCYFSNPQSFTSALTFYAVIGPNNPGNDPSEPGRIDGLDIFRCTFEDVGRLCMTLMNRSQADDRFKKLRGVRIVGNRVRRAGVAAPTFASGQAGVLHGMFSSADGCGEGVLIAYNDLEGLQGIGIEQVCQTGVVGHRWLNVDILHNTFRDFSRGLHMLSIDDGGGSGGFSGLRVHGNRPAGDVTGARHSNLFGMDASCVLRDNELPGRSTDQAALIRRAGKWLSEDNRYVSTGDSAHYAAIIESGAIRSNRDRYECAGAGTYAAVRFLNAAATGSTLTSATLVKGTAGSLVDQTSGAFGNTVRSFSTDTASDVQTTLTVTMAADADFTLTQGAADIVNYNYIRINQPVSGPLTAARTITIAPREGFDPIIVNRTSQTLIIAGGTSSTFLSRQQSALFHSNGTASLTPATPLPQAGFNAGIQGLLIGGQRFYRDSNGAWRDYTGTTATPDPQSATDGRPVGLVASTTLANLPSSGLTAGQIAYATNARALTQAGGLEAAGAGTGSSVTWNGQSWRLTGTNIVATT